jgi:outer membrane protein TolC
MRPLANLLLALAAGLLGAVPLAAQSPDSAAGGVRAGLRAPRPLSLEDAVRLAQHTSETIGIARADVARAHGDQRRARSGYYPQLAGSLSYQRALRSQFSVLQSDTASSGSQRCSAFVADPSLTVEERLAALESSVECSSNSNPFAGLSDLPFGRANTYRFGLSASQALYTGGRLGGLTQSAAASLRSAELGVTSARAQTVLDVTQAYYDASLGDRLVTIAQVTLEQAETTLAQTQLARTVGNQSEFEVLRARVTRDNIRPIVIQRRADRDLAYYRLKQFLELPVAEPLQLTTELGDTVVVQEGQLADIVETLGDTAVERRLAVRQAAETVNSQEGQLRVARAQRYPQLTLSSDFADLGYPGNVSPIGTDFVSDWSLTLAVSVPLFTGGRMRGEVESARANVEQAQLRLKQTQKRAQLDALNAELQLATAVAAWEASAGTEEQAARAYQIAELRYREGLSTLTELNDQRLALALAQSTRARAARDLQVAKVRFLLLPSLPLGASGGATAGAASGGSTAGITTTATTTMTTATTNGFTR